VGLDLAPGMVKVLNERITARGFVNAEAFVGDGDALPFADQSFDAVMCAFTLFFFPKPAKALAEFRRVLRAGGRVAVGTFTKAGSASIDGTWQLISAYLPVPPATGGPRFDETQQLVDALTAAGFVEIVVDEALFEVRLPSPDAWLEWLRSMEFRDHVDRLDQEQLLGLRKSARLRFPMDALITTATKR
jgi:O-methyltransferase/aklanonic acid methyltransferase